MRDTTPAALAALGSNDLTLALLVYMDLVAGPLRLNSSVVTLSWDGYDWVGAGGLGSVDEVKESVSERKPIRFQLSGLPTAVMATVLGNSVRDRDCQIWLAVLNPTTHALLDVIPTWAGKLSQASITRSTDSRVISVTAAHIGDYFDRPKPFRQTDADQRRAYSGDTSRRFIVSQSQHQDAWPAASFFKR